MQRKRKEKFEERKWKFKAKIKNYNPKIDHVIFCYHFPQPLRAQISGKWRWSSCGQGQCCSAGTRVFVQEGVYEAFCKKAVEKAKSSVVGDPFKSGVEHGPIVSVGT